MTRPPADWYPDPRGQSRLRYWNGRRWTSRMRPEPDPGTPKRGWTPLKDLPTPEPRSWFARHKLATAGLAVAVPFFLLVAGVAIGPEDDAAAVTTIAVEDDGEVDVPSTPTPTPGPTPEPDPLVEEFLREGLPAPSERDLRELRAQCTAIQPDAAQRLDEIASKPAEAQKLVQELGIVCPDTAKILARALRDPDGDGKLNYEDDYPRDASRWTESDRDGDGVPNKRDVAPDDPSRSAWDTGTVTRIIDGDTVEVGGYGTIRVIGIDTPERDECGYDKASQVMADLVLGKTVTLTPGAADDRDRYDRLLRYLDVGNVDAGLELIRRGLAIARYDSRDGYEAHPREQQYISADASSPSRSQDYCPAPPAPQPQQQSPAQSAPGGTEPWNLPGPDLDCADIGHRVYITGPDYHGLDRDGDGIGCDSYG